MVWISNIITVPYYLIQMAFCIQMTQNPGAGHTYILNTPFRLNCGCRFSPEEGTETLLSLESLGSAAWGPAVCDSPTEALPAPSWAQRESHWVRSQERSTCSPLIPWQCTWITSHQSHRSSLTTHIHCQQTTSGCLKQREITTHFHCMEKMHHTFCLTAPFVFD